VAGPRHPFTRTRHRPSRTDRAGLLQHAISADDNPLGLARASADSRPSR